MSSTMHKILESKRAMRNELAALSFSEKIKILEKLRDRSLAIRSSSLAQKVEGLKPESQKG